MNNQYFSVELGMEGSDSSFSFEHIHQEKKKMYYLEASTTLQLWHIIVGTQKYFLNKRMEYSVPNICMEGKCYIFEVDRGLTIF